MGDRWFYVFLFLVVVSFFIPAFTEVPFDQRQTSKVVLEVIEATSKSYSWLAPVIHITTFLILGLILTKRGVGRVIDVYFTVILVFITLSNNIAVTESYGWVVLTGNLVPMIIVASLWFLETCKPENDYNLSRLPFWRYWVIPFSILAFWFPVGPSYGPNFDPVLLLSSDYGIFFCPTVPVILALLTLSYPRVNRLLLKTTSLVGLIVGLFNAMTLFLEPDYTIWLFVLHTPLIFISLYGLILPKLVRT